ncbi:hypothetical protein V2A60_003431 [Cordyceps javanica]
MSRATNSERSPLLRIQSRESDARSFSVTNVTPSAVQITAVCLLLAVTQQVASVLAALAAQDLSRAAICGRLHDDVSDPAGDERCHEFPVLTQLSTLELGDAILTALIGIAAPIPVGVAADRWGRRPFLTLALVGGALNAGSRMLIYGFPNGIPLRLTWLSTSFELFSGTFFAIICTILTDVTSKRQRSTSFFYVVAASILATEIGLQLGGFLTDKFGPWPVLATAFGAFVFSVLCAFCIPETVHLNKTSYNEEAVEEEPAAQTTTQSMRSAILAAYKGITTAMAALFWGDKKLGILLLTLLMVALSSHSIKLLLLYTSYRYQMAFDKVTSIHTIETASQFFLNAIFLPLTAQALLSFNFSARRKDAMFVRWGLVVAAVGLFGVGLAPKIGYMIAALVLYTFVSAYSGGMLGLLSQLTSEGHLAALFATTRVLASVGSLLGVPLSKCLFQVGEELGTAWAGLPYLVLGGIYTLTAVVVFATTSAAASE